MKKLLLQFIFSFVILCILTFGEEVQEVYEEVPAVPAPEVPPEEVQPTPATTVFTKPMFTINLMGKELNLYQDEYILSMASACGSISENWKEFYETIIEPGNYCVDINAGFGWSFIHMLSSIQDNGVAVGVSIDGENYHVLRDNVHRHQHWNRTFIVQTEFYTNFNAGQSVMGNIYSLLQGNCPKLITSRRLQDSEPNMLEVIADSTEVLFRCFPVIYIDTNDLDMLTSIVHSLSLSSYSFYIQKLRCNCINPAAFGNRVGFIAMVDAHRTEKVQTYLDENTKRINSPAEVKYYSEHMCDQPEVEDRFTEVHHRHTTETIPSHKYSILPWSGAEQEKYVSLETITVELDIVTDVYSPLRCFWKHLDLQREAAAFEFYIDQSIVNGTYRASATLQCTSWINTLIHTSVKRYANTNHLQECQLDYGELFFYGSLVSQNCKDFALRRLELVLHMHLNRKFSAGVFPDVVLPGFMKNNKSSKKTKTNSTQEQEILSPEVISDINTTNSTETVLESIADIDQGNQRKQNETSEDIDSVPKHQLSLHYYNVSHKFSVKDWMERDVFEAKYQPEFCGEPIFCEMMVEFQRRLYHWQHPPRFLHDAKYKSFPYFNPAPGVTRTCETVRYLVYEPATRLNGIGSFFELIGSALRLAICLDRVLVLNLYDQSGTFLKWRHFGCTGNTFECYFQPISSCVLPEDLAPKGNASSDAMDFHLFPLKLERVLYLKGLPNSEVCSLCNSRWPHDSTFFNGLYIMGDPFEPERLEEPTLVHAAAFMEAIRLPYLAQHLRYMLRPRAWLKEAVTQMVKYAMVSPVILPASDDNDSQDTTTLTSDERNAERQYHPLVNRKYAEDSTFNLTSKLPLEEFPKEYLSLHVRWGMKIAEVALEPLTRYMTFIAKKFPHVKDIFVSTETQLSIHSLLREFPQYRFHFLHYLRSEYIDLRKDISEISGHNPFVYEFMFSMANLFTASEGQGFVGTLSSNWCVMIEQLERTRGDGGYDYFSMDRGSAFSTCF